MGCWVVIGWWYSEICVLLVFVCRVYLVGLYGDSLDVFGVWYSWFLVLVVWLFCVVCSGY